LQEDSLFINNVCNEMVKMVLES